MSLIEHQNTPTAKLHNQTLRDRVDPQTLAKLDAVSRKRHYPKGATIVAQGEHLDFVGNVMDGVVRLEKTLSDGRQHIVGLLAPTDMFGRVFSERSEFAIEAATDVTLCCMERHAFEKLVAENPDLEHAVLLAVLDELDASREWIMLLAGTTVAARFATYLLIQCRRWPKQTTELTKDRKHIIVSVLIGRNDLAHYLGTTAESISRTVQGLARAGILRVLTSSQFEILDLDGLVATAGHDDFSASTMLADLQAAQSKS